MPTIRVYLLAPTDRPHLQCQWIDPDTGAKVTRTTRTADEEEARRFAAAREYELNHGLLAPSGAKGPQLVTWEDLVEQYDRLHLSSLKSPTARSNALRALTVLGEGITYAREADERAVSESVARLRTAGRRPGTIHSHLTRVRAALRWAARHRLIERAPALSLPRYSRKAGSRSIDAAGYARLRRAAPGATWRLLIDLAWYTGCRRGELLALTWDDPARPVVDLTARRITLPAEWNKGQRDDWLPIHPELLTLLGRVPRGRRVGLVLDGIGCPDHVTLAFKEIAVAAGLAGLTLHDLRRSFGTRYAPVVPAQVLQRLMRHRSISTTLRFYADLDLSLDQAISRA